MTERDALKIRRLLLVVVDASQGPNGDWTHREAGPSGLDLALSATDAAFDAAARNAADAFERMVLESQDPAPALRFAPTPPPLRPPPPPPLLPAPPPNSSPP